MEMKILKDSEKRWRRGIFPQFELYIEDHVVNCREIFKEIGVYRLPSLISHSYFTVKFLSEYYFCPICHDLIYFPHTETAVIHKENIA